MWIKSGGANADNGVKGGDVEEERKDDQARDRSQLKRGHRRLGRPAGLYREGQGLEGDRRGRVRYWARRGK
jgi:hypothetical protein